ncbi:MAG: NAD synthetase [Planctomycetes bacterium]|nr:NAD synthetase [Planctomycetota bacterium]MDP6408213.1 NAD(P)(+) transhydrogenase (Re/Si-specific) subunit beta [Planctomycetota bacterium]
MESPLIQGAYMASALLFILGISRLGRVRSARAGNRIAALAMLVAVVATTIVLWGDAGRETLWAVLAGGVALGSVIGLVLARRVAMTAMPELVALFNGLGGAASMLVAWAELERARGTWASGPRGADGLVVSEGLFGLGTVNLATLYGPLFVVAAVLSILIGAVTLSGSLVAYGKLAGKIRGARLGPLGIRPLNAVLLATAVAVAGAVGFAFAGDPETAAWAIYALVGLTLLLGIGLVVPIGGADMPVVISLLNSYSGLAACSTGFVLQNNLLIVAGSLVGASGLILTKIMCRAMNRSLANVLFAGIDAGSAGGDQEYTGVKSTSAAELAMVLDAAQSVIIVPGYGLAVAQAQHKVQELATLLEGRGCEVRYAIHPVAGRMPGHMNVLLAEASVPYERLFELDEINGDFKNTDVTIVVGANDVCNPAAYEEGSAIAGMPVLDVWDSRTVVVVKRSLSPGYAGIKNELFERDNALMLFDDARAAIEEAVSEFGDL